MPNVMYRNAVKYFGKLPGKIKAEIKKKPLLSYVLAWYSDANSDEIVHICMLMRCILAKMLPISF